MSYFLQASFRRPSAAPGGGFGGDAFRPPHVPYGRNINVELVAVTQFNVGAYAKEAMDNIIIKVVNRVAYVLGDFEPGALLDSESGAKLLVTGRRRELDPRYVEVLKIAGELADAPDVTSVARALVVSSSVPRPGETVKPHQWPADRPGIYSPEGAIDLLAYNDIPHLWIVGATGSGKTTLAKMLIQQAAEQRKRIVVFDMHDEYCQTIQQLGGLCMPIIVPFCDLSDNELLALTGLARVTQAIRMMRYLSYFRRAFCKLAQKVQINNLTSALQRCADAMLLLDILKTDTQTLTGQDSIMVEFVRTLREELGNTAFNALKEVVRKDEERMAATMMYLLQSLENVEVSLNYELPRIVAVRLLDFRSIFHISDVALAGISYFLRKLMELREEALVVLEETPRFLQDEVAKKNVALFLSQSRKFKIQTINISQTPDELMQNARLVAGKTPNPAYAKKIAELSPQMPWEVARLLPQLTRGQFVYMDGQRTIPIRVVV
jgi:energy-coupling factor transporter ATP-binding protein EcfA2